MFNAFIISKRQEHVDFLREFISWRRHNFHPPMGISLSGQIWEHLADGKPALVMIDTAELDDPPLDLVQRIRQISQSIQMILITSEKNFDLAQAALHYQVADLLIWDELKPDTLLESLKKITGEMDNILHRQGIVKRQLCRDILKGKLPTRGEIIRYFEIQEPHPRYVMFRINRDIPYSVIRSGDAPVADYYAVNWHGSNFPSEFNYIATVNVSMHSWCSFLQIKDIASSARIHNITHAAAVALQSSFKQQFHDTVSIAYSKPFTRFDHVVALSGELDYCLKMQIYYGRARLTNLEDLPSPQKAWSDTFDQMAGQLSFSLLYSDLEKAIGYIQKIFQLLTDGFYSYEFIEKVCDILVSVLNDFCLKQHIATLHERVKHQELPNPQCYTVSEITVWFIDAVTVLLNETDHHVVANYSQKIQSVIDYIDKNYGKNDDINSLASRFHISSDYLRHLFKKETGENLGSYITRIKIEKAKLLLRTGLYKVNDVAKITGFNTTQYFGTVFRKYEGISPREFITQQEHQNHSLLL